MGKFVTCYKVIVAFRIVPWYIHDSCAPQLDTGNWRHTCGRNELLLPRASLWSDTKHAVLLSLVLAEERGDAWRCPKPGKETPLNHLSNSLWIFRQEEETSWICATEIIDAFTARSYQLLRAAGQRNLFTSALQKGNGALQTTAQQGHCTTPKFLSLH